MESSGERTHEGMHPEAGQAYAAHGSAPPSGTTAQAQRAPRAGLAGSHDQKSPLIACFLSAMPGLGQVYVGYYQRGFIHILVVGSTISFLSSGVPSGLEPLFGLFLAFFWLYNIIDAGRRAVFYNHVLEGGEPTQLPQDFTAPGIRGSMMAGGVLIVAGFVLLLNTKFGVSLEWLGEWWPLLPVAFGAYLFYKAVQDRLKE